MPKPLKSTVRAINILVDVIFPPQCLSCNKLVSTNVGLCHECWNQIDFIEDPKCEVCGIPFDYDIGKDALCGLCVQSSPPFSKARSVCKYNDHSKNLVTGFKFNDKININNLLAKWMHRSHDGLLNEADIVIPVPLHRIRLWQRKYNQSALLASVIGKMGNKKIIYDFLVRKKHTKAQSGLTFAQRQKNLRGAFTLNKKYNELIKDKNILLIDDVMTTGATVITCAKILKRNGAKTVNILTFARTLREV